MSHFTVVVRVPGSTALEEVEDAVTDILAPYQENNMGDCPQEYLEFEDETETFRKEYEEESNEQIRLADGTLLFPFDEQFKKVDPRRTYSYLWEYPEDSEKVMLPNKEIYPTFEFYAEDYQGREPDALGRYGYWHNPSCKWDWWVIGGRWSGFFPVRDVRTELIGEPGTGGNAPRENCVDITRISDIDTEAIAALTQNRIKEFWENYDKYIARGPGLALQDPFHGPRSDLLSVGLLQCKGASEITLEDRLHLIIPWKADKRRSEARFDIVDTSLTTPEARAEIAPVLGAQFNRIRPYSYVDGDGWEEPGSMGWWGMSSENPESAKMYADKFTAWVKGGDQSDWLVNVDCHI